MKPALRTLAAGLLAFGLAGGALARVPAPGADVDSLLAIARRDSPEYAAMRFEADAAGERVTPAGALPDPKFRVELRDLTKSGEQDPTLLPNRVGNTRYQLMQDLPWYGKRALRAEVAGFEAEAARGRADATWLELAAKLKTAFAQHYLLDRTTQLTHEILDLTGNLEQVARARYAGGLAPQQDVIRAQVEQTNLKSELAGLEAELHHLHARLNALLARPAGAPLATPERLRPLPAPEKLARSALEARVRARNPQLFAEDARLKAAEKSRELAYRNRYPDFTLGVAPIQYGSAVREWELMVELNIPLQQDARRAQERESEATLAAARARKLATANQLLLDLAENLAGIESARWQEALVTTSLLPQAEAAFQAAVAGYETGKVDFATLLDAQRQIRQAKQTQLKAQTEVQARLAEIERLVGEDL